MTRSAQIGFKEGLSDHISGSNWFQRALLLLTITAILLVVYQGSRAIFADAQPPVRLDIYGFSTQEEAFNQHILPAFETAWEAENGHDLMIIGVFGPSGTLASEINLGAPADVAIFSNAQHVNWLVMGRRVKPDTQAEIIGSTPMVIVTPPGNPAGIADFMDLSQPGLQILHPEPGHSGAGDWGVLAEYGSAWLASGDRAAAEEQVKAIWQNVKVLGSSARATLTLFELGAGDAMITYEQDALLALDRGVDLEIVIPPRTIVAQPVAVLVDDNITDTERAAAEAFVRYLLSEDGQKVFEQYHMRPPEIESPAFPTIAQPFTVTDLNGWSQAYRELVNGLWKSEIQPNLDILGMPKLTNGTE